MRAPVARLALAALTAVFLAACNDTPDRLLAPRASPSKVVIVDRPPPIPVGSCNPALIICAMTLNVDVSTGNGVTCSVRASGAAFCWGDNYYGMLGAGVYSLPETCTPYLTSQLHPCATKPLAVAGGRAFAAISVGADHVCAIEKGTGAGFCWGAAQAGQLGSPQSVPFLTTPTAVAIPSDDTIPLSFTSISAGGSSTCGITNKSFEYCWGSGFGAPPVRQTRNSTVSFRSVSTGETSPCAIDLSGNSCKGFNHPYAFIGQATTASHFCQISASGITECWGTNTFGQLGNASTGGTATQPGAVSGTVPFQFVSTGAFHTCALNGGAAFCWGSNRFYQLGIGSTSSGSNIPLAVAVPSGNPQFTKIAAGGGHTCALDSQGGVWCWGLDDVGQVGNGGSLTVTDPNVPPYWAGIAQPVRAANPLQ